MILDGYGANNGFAPSRRPFPPAQPGSRMTAMSEPPRSAPLRKMGVIGYPLSHSVSPAFHQAALDHYGLNMTYERWETPPEHAEWRFGGLRPKEVLGANVTVPYKEFALRFVDSLDETARLIGAVNTIVNIGGHLTGYNTDAAGFLRALKEDGAFDPAGKAAHVLGAGGAARAVVFALAGAGARSIAVANRTSARSEALVGDVRKEIAGATVEAIEWGASAGGVDLIVNTTSMGMRNGGAEDASPLSADEIPRGALVVDLVYNPELTPLLAAASEAGARTLGGLPMLIYQGAEAFEMWIGRKAPIEVMNEAARAALAMA